MKNIQVIDGADNCTYSIFAISDDDFKIIFPEEEQDVEFNTDLEARMNKQDLVELSQRLWKKPIDKKSVNGIDGTVFYNLEEKKKYYSTKKEKEIKTII